MKFRGNSSGQRKRIIAILVVVMALMQGAAVVWADELETETIADDLRLPTAIAVRSTPSAEQYQVFVADVGAGQVVRFDSSKRGSGALAITGFVTSSDADGLMHLPGPRGLLLLDLKRMLVVGSEGDRRPFVRLYELTDEEKPMSAEQAEQEAKVAADALEAAGEVDGFCAVARTYANDQVPDFLVLTGLSKGAGASVWRLPVRSSTLGELKVLSKPQSASPVAIAVEPGGHIVVIRPDLDTPGESRLAFINPIDGHTVVDFTVKLSDIVAAAYSPNSGNLYAVRNSTRDAQQNGVYRIDAVERSTEPAATALRVSEVAEPTALAFGPDNVLYVTSLDSSRRRGTLLKIKGDL
jgi:hypothetical protein